ncbi:MAG: alpha/beta hydrolase family protein [Stenotrophobium sp.]
MLRKIILLSFFALCLTACGSSQAPGANTGTGSNSVRIGTEGVGASDHTCDLAVYPSVAWTQCEATNFAKISEGPTEELQNPAFLTRYGEQSSTNTSSLIARDTADPSWLLASSMMLNQLLAAVQNPTAISSSLQQALSGVLANPEQAISLNANTPLTSLTATYAGPAVGDPFRYPEATGPDGDQFYTNEAVVTPVVFYDSGCARLSGHVWRPKNIAAGTTLPGIVIDNGSVQAEEAAYWWAAQALVRDGYEVMTYDPRGQGRSDFTTPSGGQGTNINPSVFWLGLVNAIDFFRSSPDHPYPNNAACANDYPTQMTPYNPNYAGIDPARLGIAGHSLGAIGVSVVQGYGAPGADPWPGILDKTNPVDAAVAWDGLLKPGGGLIGGAAQGGGIGNILYQLGVADPAFRLVIERGLPNFGARVPSMGQSSDYGLLFSPFLNPPDPEQHKAEGYDAWKAAGVPSYEIGIQGSTHVEWSNIAPLPATSWCPDTSSGACSGGWGMPMARYYTVAWFDRWLKKPGEPGYADADARLLDDGGPQGADKMSFRYLSARDFPDRSGYWHHCEDIRAGCTP